MNGKLEKIANNSSSCKEKCVDFKMLKNMLSLSKPDLKIICEGNEIVFSYKVLLGTKLRYLGYLFLQEEFSCELMTTLVVPHSSENVKNFIDNIHLEKHDIFSHAESKKFMKKNKQIEPKILKHKDDGITKQFTNVSEPLSAKNPEGSNPEIGEICALQGKDKGDNILSTISNSEEQGLSLKLYISKKEEEEGEECQNCRKIKFGSRCSGCQKTREQKPKLDSGPQVCSQCNKVFKNETILRHHVKYIHNPDLEYFYCHQCNFKSKYKFDVKVHQKDHVQIELLPCHICGGKYKGEKRLLKHMKRVHEDAEFIKCEECGKKIKGDKQNLKTHKNKVHSERKYHCTFCSYKAQSNFNLKLHINKSHLGIKDLEKFQCPHCEVATTNLPYHLKQFHLHLLDASSVAGGPCFS